MSNAPYQIEQTLAILVAARKALLEDDPDIEHDESLLADILGSDPETCTEMELLHGMLRAVVAAEDMADAAATRLIEVSLRRDRYKKRAERLRLAAFAAMDMLELKRIELPDLTASLGNTPRKVIAPDEDAVPLSFKRVKYELDKVLLKASLEAGEVVPGATLSDAGKTLRISRR